MLMEYRYITATQIGHWYTEILLEYRNKVIYNHVQRMGDFSDQIFRGDMNNMGDVGYMSYMGDIGNLNNAGDIF